MTPTTTYEAVQERPLPHARRALDSRNGDWRLYHERVARELPTLVEAERYARRILGQRPGVPVHILRRERTIPRDRWAIAIDRVATVSRDALGRTWTDLNTMEPLL